MTTDFWVDYLFIKHKKPIIILQSPCFFFQASDDIPVHLKRGVPDRLLYRTTMALTVGGALYCLVALYIAAQPKNK